MRKVALVLVAVWSLILGVVQPSQAAVVTTVTLHYQPEAGNTDSWSLWVWEPNQNGFTQEFTSTDSFGKVATIEFDHAVSDLGFIVKVGAFAKRDGQTDRSIRNFENGKAEVWVYGGQSAVLTLNPGIVLPKPILPSWARSASIYEVNVRQFSSASDKFAGIEAQIPRF